MTATDTPSTAATPAKSGFAANRRPIPTARPRLLGSRERLQQLAAQRPENYRRMLEAARKPFTDGFYEINAKMIGLAIAYVLEGNKTEAREAVDLALKLYIDKPIQEGHVTFAHSMARCAIVYDLCHDLWTPEERKRFSAYVHATIAANPDSEPSTFHNGWYGYKHWGYGMAGYALMHDDPEAATILKNLETDYLNLAVPALKMAGEGGAWAEGYYIHYWLFEWLFFCETARIVEGMDYYAAAPEFFDKRAIAGMFEMYPPLQPPAVAPPVGDLPAIDAPEFSYRPIPMGDGHGKLPKHERDKALASRRILVNYHRNDPAHQAVHAFDAKNPRVAIPCDAYMDFLFNDPSIKTGDLDTFKLSHVGPGAGFVYARSSWQEDATHFFFKSGRRFTAHQHLDNGHFMIFKNEELLSDGAHYDNFASDHAVNYYLRTIAHNSILIFDPAETFPKPGAVTPKGLRAGPPATNDGGQYYPWSTPNLGLGHNGGAANVTIWRKNKSLMDIGRLAAFKEGGSYVYAVGDFTKSYSPHKAKTATRQIVYLRPGTFVIFDRVESTNPAFKKTVLFQAAKMPEKKGEHLVVTHGKGRLFIQTLAPAIAVVTLHHGDKLYEYNGTNHPPTYQPDAAPDCRIEVSPAIPATFDYFLHVLTATDSGVEKISPASSVVEGREVVVTVGQTEIRFSLDGMASSLIRGGKKELLVEGGADFSFE